MKNLCCMLCFFSFTIGSAEFKHPDLIEKIEMQIMMDEAMKTKYPLYEDYLRGRINGLQYVLSELTHASG